MTILCDLSAAAAVGTRVRYVGGPVHGLETGDEGVITGVDVQGRGYYGVRMDNPRGRDLCPLHVIGPDVEGHWWTTGDDFEIASAFFAGARVRITQDRANYAPVSAGDLATLVRLVGVGPRPFWSVTLDSDTHPNREGRWRIDECHMEVVSESETPDETVEFQAFRRRVVEALHARRGSLTSGQQDFIDDFLRGDLGLGDILDTPTPTPPPVVQMAVTFYVDVPQGQQEALREWVEAANPGARGIVVSHPGE